MSAEGEFLVSSSAQPATKKAAIKINNGKILNLCTAIPPENKFLSD